MKKILSAKFLVSAIIFICGINNLKAQYVNIPDVNFKAWLINHGFATCISGNMLDTTCTAVTTVTSINCMGQSISDLTGIQYFDNLKSLVCSNNPILSLPSLPSTLQYLDCNTNLLSGLPNLPTSLLVLKCFNNQIIALPGLPNALHHLDCNTNLISSLPALPNSLDSIHCGHNQLISLPTLPSSLLYLTCKENQLTSLPVLPNLLKWLDCNVNQITTLPSLPNSLIILLCQYNQLINIPALPNLLIDCWCSYNHLTSLPSLPSSLGRLLCDSNQLSTLPALPNSIFILRCDHNQITNIPSLPSSLDEVRCNNNQLAVLPALPNSLSQLICSYNPITVLPVLPNTLTGLWCYNNQLTALPTLPNSLKALYCFNNQLSALPELPDTLDHLNCSGNINLHCFPQLKYIGNLNFQNTSITCLPNYGNITYSSPAISTIPLCGLFNPNGCPAFWNLSGRSYFDANINCIFDSADVGQVNSHIDLYENSNLIQQVFTGGEGFYSFQATNTGNYNSVIDTAGLPFEVFCPSSLSYNNTITLTDTLHYSNNFSMKCKPGFDVGVLSIQACVFRPVHETLVNIHAGDISSFYGAHCAAGISGSVLIVIGGSANYVSPAPGSLTPDIISGDSLYYIINDFGVVHFNTDFNIIVVTDTFALIGSQVCFTVTVLPMAGDNNVSNNKLAHCFVVVGSYDPNDKQVDPIAYVDPFGDRWLTYTVNFQNTGTAEAEHIYVTDTLDQNLDLSTFELLAYSHHVVAQILDGGIARFNFPNINLPDSNTNEPASHGYVQYRIKLKDNTATGSQVSNTAYIYFDFNSPVQTNTTVNTVSAVGIAEVNTEMPVSVFPNPTRNEFTVYSPQFTADKKIFLKVVDAFGKEMINKLVTNATTLLETGNWSSGIYFLRIETTDGIVVRKLVKE